MEAFVANAFCVSLPRSAHEVLICGLPVISLKCLGFGVFRFALDVAGQPARCSTTRKGTHSSTFTLFPIFEDNYTLLHLTLLLRIIDFSKLTSLRSLTLDNALSLVLIRAALRRPLSGTPLPNNCADPRIITDRVSHKPFLGTCTLNWESSLYIGLIVEKDGGENSQSGKSEGRSSCKLAAIVSLGLFQPQPSGCSCHRPADASHSKPSFPSLIPFRVSSPKQLSIVLHNSHSLPSSKRSPICASPSSPQSLHSALQLWPKVSLIRSRNVLWVIDLDYSRIIANEDAANMLR
jgi:hypothetical protein